MKKILILGAGLEQCLAIKEAQSLGYEVVACDQSLNAPGLLMANVGITVDIRNIDELIKIAQQHSVNGVFCHAVEIPEVVALISEAIGTPSLSSQIAKICTDKHLRIKTLQESGIAVASFKTTNNINELIYLAEDFGYPLVLKPVDNAGSRGVQLVKNRASLISAYKEAMTYTKNPIVLIEKYLKGPQISTESLVYKGEIHTFGFADRNYSNDEFYAPYFIEDGINFPSVLEKDLQEKILDLVNKTIHCLGINFGAAKGDIIVHEGIPHIIEMASRTSGGWFAAGSIPKATGINPLKPLLQMSVGDEPDLGALSSKWMLGCAQRYWIPKNSCTFLSSSNLEQIPLMPGVEIFDSFFPDSGTKLDKAQNHAQRYAHVICTGHNREEAINRANSAINAINVETSE
jgi:biotin carboxylase